MKNIDFKFHCFVNGFKFYALFSFIFLANICKAQAQKINDLGEGAVKIEMLGFSGLDTVKMDPAHHLIMDYYYHIYHRMVLRKDDESSIPLTTSAQKENTNTDSNNVSVTHSFYAKMIIPSYLINLDKKVMYTFYTQKNQPLISEDSLKSNTEDVFYRLLLLNDTSKHKILIDTVKQQHDNIAGIDGYQARYLYKNHWRKFTYTTKTLPFLSPLNVLFLVKSPFPFPLLSIDLENVSPTDPNQVTAILRFRIVKIDADKQDPALFKLPKDVPILKNVSPLEMYKIN